MSRKVLVTGASGLLGRELLRRFAQQKWKCLGLAFSRAGGELVRVDLRDRKEVEKVLDDFRPTVVVHAAAERRPDVVEQQPEAASRLNVSATETLAELCSKYGIFLIYMSSDYVFDGRSPPYHPDSPTNPPNKYGQTKRDGEVAVLKHAGTAVLRVPVLYGQVEQLGESSVTNVFSAVLNSDKEAKVCDYQQRYPTHVFDVAQVCVAMAEHHAGGGGGVEGVWHWSGKECFTKYAMACTMAELFGLPTSHLVPVRSEPQGTVRPYDCKLECCATAKAFPIHETPFCEGIASVLKPFVKK